MKPANLRQGRAQPWRRRDYPARKDPDTRILWRVAYLDADFGQCFEWAPTRAAAIVLRDRIRAHYSHDTQTYAPEVFIGRVLIPCGTRAELAAWLSLHLTCGTTRPAPTRDAQTMTPVKEN